MLAHSRNRKVDGLISYDIRRFLASARVSAVILAAPIRTALAPETPAVSLPANLFIEAHRNPASHAQKKGD